MQGPCPEANQADVIIDGVPYMIDRLADIAWLRTAQFMAGIEIKCNLDKKKKALKAGLKADEMEWFGRMVDSEVARGSLAV